MPAIVRLGDESAGHGCFPPVPNDLASTNVFVNDIPIHRVTDTQKIHCCGPSCHVGTQSQGSSNVFVNNLQVARMNDAYDCGDHCLQASPNVFAN